MVGTAIRTLISAQDLSQDLSHASERASICARRGTAFIDRISEFLILDRLNNQPALLRERGELGVREGLALQGREDWFEEGYLASNSAQTSVLKS